MLRCERLEPRDCPASLVESAFSAEFNAALRAEGIDPATARDAFPASPPVDGVSAVLQVVADGKKAVVFRWSGADHIPVDAGGVISRFWLDDPATADVDFELSTVETPDGGNALVAAPGPGGGPRLQVYAVDSLGNFTLTLSRFVAEESYRDGIQPNALSQLDFDGDGAKEISVFLDGGGRTTARYYSPVTGAEVASRHVAPFEHYRPLPAGYSRFVLAPNYTEVGFLMMLDADDDGVEDDPARTARYVLDTDTFQLSRDVPDGVSPAVVS